MRVYLKGLSKKTLTPDECIHIFNNAVEAYQLDHPHWHFEVLVSLIKWGLRNLKHFIEAKRDTAVTWSEPFVELHYPVRWDWKSPRNGTVIHGKQILGKVTKDTTAGIQVLTQTLAGMMAAKFNVTALGHFTNGTWFEKRKNAYIPYLPIHLDGAINELKGKRKQHQMAEELFRPFSIGAPRIDLTNIKLTPNARIPKSLAIQLKAATERMDIPGVSFSGEVNGRRIWAGLIFEIQPLIIDYDRHKAYHAITVGLAFEHRIAGNEIASMTPSEWPGKDQEVFWDELLHSLDTLSQRLIPKSGRRASIIMKDNEGLQIVRALFNPKDIDDAKRWITEFGRTDEAKHQRIQALQPLLKAIETANTAEKKGHSLEELVAQLFGSIDGFTIKGRRVQTETEEIDIVISNGSNDPTLRREEAIILAECKNWSSTCGKNEFMEFKSKMDNRKGRCSLGFLISWNGFTDTITKEMLRGSHDQLLIVPIDGKQIQQAVGDGAFLSMLMSAWNGATMI